MQKMVFLIGLLFAATSNASWVVGGPSNGINANSATVKGVTSDWGNTGDFGVLTEGGSGACTNRWVVFSKANMSAETYRNSFEIAKMAMIHGFKVNIFNYNGSDCDSVDFIEFGRL